MLIEEWMGYAVPVRDNNNTRHRRVEQGDQAMKALGDLCPDKGVIIQAGGNWGYWPMRLAKMFEQVYTFEPNPVAFACLVANTSRFENVVRLQAALGDEHHLTGLHVRPTSTGNAYVDGVDNNKPQDRERLYQGTPTLRIDDLALERCDVIYLDVEGSEEKAIKGALATIERCKPMVIYEEEQQFDDSTDACRKMLWNYEHFSAIGADIVLKARE